MVRIYALDLLRFLAALAVVLCHWCYRQTPNVLHLEIARYGAFGIQLFFLISGFVILMTAERQDFRGFIVSRLVRLYPAFWICCTITFLVCWTDPMLDLSVYLANMTMFPPTTYVPYLNEAYWTLAVEAQFYLLIAILLLFGRLERIEAVMWGWLAVSVAVVLTPMQTIALSQMFLVQFSAFFIGGCACYLLRQPSASRWALLVCAWAFALYEGYAEVGRAHARGVTFDPVVLGTIYTACFALVLAAGKGWITAPRFAATLGAISYPLYLLHQRISIEIGWTTENPLVLVAGILWIVALSWIVHRYGEAPAQRWMKRLLGGAGRAEGSGVEDGRAQANPVNGEVSRPLVAGRAAIEGGAGG